MMKEIYSHSKVALALSLCASLKTPLSLWETHRTISL